MAWVYLGLPTNIVAAIRGATKSLLIREGWMVAWERRESASVSEAQVHKHRELKRK